MLINKTYRKQRSVFGKVFKVESQHCASVLFAENEIGCMSDAGLLDPPYYLEDSKTKIMKVIGRSKTNL